jgi:hypothetical protein
MRGGGAHFIGATVDSVVLSCTKCTTAVHFGRRSGCGAISIVACSRRVTRRLDNTEHFGRVLRLRMTAAWVIPGPGVAEVADGKTGSAGVNRLQMPA